MKYSKTILHIFLDIVNIWWASKVNGSKAYKKFKASQDILPFRTEDRPGYNSYAWQSYHEEDIEHCFPADIKHFSEESPESEGMRWCQHMYVTSMGAGLCLTELPELPPWLSCDQALRLKPLVFLGHKLAHSKERHLVSTGANPSSHFISTTAATVQSMLFFYWLGIYAGPYRTGNHKVKQLLLTVPSEWLAL